MIQDTEVCELCGSSFRWMVIKQHRRKCTGIYTKRSYKYDTYDHVKTPGGKYQCGVCGELFNPLGFSMHFRCAHLGEKPNRNGSHTGCVCAAWNKGLTEETSEGVRRSGAAAKGRETTSLADWRSRDPDSFMAASRKGGLKSYKPTMMVGTCKGAWREDSFGEPQYLQSSFETRCADTLDALEIRWTRPEGIKYRALDGVVRRCFLDFYLPDLSIYLDPKGPHLVEKDKPKFQLVRDEHKITLIMIEKPLIEDPAKLTWLLAEYIPS